MKTGQCVEITKSLMGESVRELRPPWIPVMVVTHSRSSVLMSFSSQAPASAGTGRGATLERDSSGLEIDAEGAFSV